MLIQHKLNGKQQKVSKADFEKMPNNVKEMYSVVSKDPAEVTKAKAGSKKSEDSKEA